MKKIFEPATLTRLQLKNRLIRSATFETGGARHGLITPYLAQIHKALAEGGVGLIITGMMGVGRNSCINGSMVKLYDESFVPLFAADVEEVHRAGGKIVVQLGHSGAHAAVLEDGKYPYAPSDYQAAKAMTVEQIRAVVEDYGNAALQCKLAGSDGVQVHGAHGYLISQFLSPYFNKREDAYGGTIENRARFLLEVFRSIRAKVGSDYPVLLKINYSDLVDANSTREEIVWVCSELEKIGIDALEVSAGIGIDSVSLPSQPSSRGEGFFSEYALQLAARVDTPVISVGGYRSLARMEEVLNQGNVAAISLSRPLISEPDLPRRWESGEHVRPRCVACNQCYLQRKLHCVMGDV